MGNFFRSVLGAAAALLQSKSVTATTSQQTVLPDNGYDGLSQVTVNPQSHSGTVTISAKYETGNGYDMGANHSKRYIKTSGLMVTPTATKSITANGNSQDVLNYAKVNVAVPITSLISNAYAFNYSVSEWNVKCSSSVYFSGTVNYGLFFVFEARDIDFSDCPIASTNSGTLTLLYTNRVYWSGGFKNCVTFSIYKLTGATNPTISFSNNTTTTVLLGGVLVKVG